MKTPFKDPVSSKNKKSSYEFAAPTGDEMKMAAGSGYGMGDSYGTGIKPKIGTMGKTSTENSIPKTALKFAPKAMG